MSKHSSEDRIVTAVKSEAPLVGAPAEYLDVSVVREKTIQLKHPLRLEGTEYRSVTVRKLTGKEIFAVNRAVRQGKEPEAAMFAAMCRLPVPVIEALDGDDITTISKLAANFTPQSLDTAEEPTGENGEST